MKGGDNMNFKKAAVATIITMSLKDAVSYDYAEAIKEAIVDDVLADVNECADNREWNSDDVKLATGRVLCKKLGIEL